MWRVLPEIHALRGYRALNNQERTAHLLAGLPSRLIAEALDRLPIWTSLAAYQIGLRMDLEAQVVLWVTWFFFSFAWLIAALWLFSRGQTPGKRLMGIRVIKRNGDPAVWWRMFARETLIKWFLILNGLWFAWSFIGFPGQTGLGSWSLTYGLWSSLLLALDILGIAMVVGYLLPLWDRNRQALHDKVMGTAVVSARR